mmetsp:Transcript_26935/g.51047  ORF Transcript_26935/g.51047 Transcript_26935/m.51047 type:complete len:304 (-) Transcript_26935:388-1299(-)
MAAHAVEDLVHHGESYRVVQKLALLAQDAELLHVHGKDDLVLLLRGLLPPKPKAEPVRYAGVVLVDDLQLAVVPQEQILDEFELVLSLLALVLHQVADVELELRSNVLGRPAPLLPPGHPIVLERALVNMSIRVRENSVPMLHVPAPRPVVLASVGVLEGTDALPYPSLPLSGVLVATLPGGVTVCNVAVQPNVDAVPRLLIVNPRPLVTLVDVDPLHLPLAVLPVRLPLAVVLVSRGVHSHALAAPDVVLPLPLVIAGFLSVVVDRAFPFSPPVDPLSVVHALSVRGGEDAFAVPQAVLDVP